MSSGELSVTPFRVTGIGDNGPLPAKRKEGDVDEQVHQVQVTCKSAREVSKKKVRSKLTTLKMRGIHKSNQGRRGREENH
jgi:hypothetical protein